MAKPCKTLKIVCYNEDMLVGAAGVGKTLLMNQFLSNSEDREASNNKLGAIMNSSRMMKIDSEEYLLELVECEELGFSNKVLNQDLKNADGFLFIFSHTNKESIEYLKQCKGSITKERTKPLACILVGTVPGDPSPAASPNTTPTNSSLTLNISKKHSSLRGKPPLPINVNNNINSSNNDINNPTVPTRSHSNNGISLINHNINTPTQPTRSQSNNGISMSSSNTENTKELVAATQANKLTNDATTTLRDSQDLCALFDTSLTRVVIRNKQVDRSVISDLFSHLVREIVSSGSSRKKAKFRYSRCDSEDLQFVTDITQREADSDITPPSIKAASFPRLVERATYEKHPNPELVDDLLITYRAFSKATAFLDLLISRYDIKSMFFYPSFIS